MLNSTIELIALWASSSSPSLLAFCGSHLIIAVLLIAGSGTAPDISGGNAAGGISLEADAGVQGKETNPEGHQDRIAAIGAGGGWSCAHGVNGRTEECWVRVGDRDGAVETVASEKGSAREEEPAAAGALQEEKHGEDAEDELMLRAEEFIRRMNRVWVAENLRVR
uniref:Uncharacterized protein n=1 Tax=Leersia perrieri TaxID=77586 RepID=A0A0D9VRW5_9ORYZ